jgi:UPF0271 protein
MSHVYVIDSGVLFSTWTKKVLDGTFTTTMAVVDEIRNRPSILRMGILETLDRLEKETPASDSIRAAAKAADETGDKTVLSETDIELIALAYSKMKDGTRTTLVSTDMAVLNTAKHLGIDIIDPTGRFKDDIEWIMVCPACGHKSKQHKTGIECPVCGTQMRRKVLRKSRKR